MTKIKPLSSYNIFIRVCIGSLIFNVYMLRNCDHIILLAIQVLYLKNFMTCINHNFRKQHILDICWGVYVKGHDILHIVFFRYIRLKIVCIFFRRRKFH